MEIIRQICMQSILLRETPAGRHKPARNQNTQNRWSFELIYEIAQID